MATHQSVTVVDIDTAEALSRGYFVRLASGLIEVCDAAGARCDGVSFNDVTAAGDPCGVQVGGIIKVKVGATPVAKGAKLTPDANGLAVTAAAGDYVRCKALEAGAAGAFIAALWADDVEDGT